MRPSPCGLATCEPVAGRGRRRPTVPPSQRGTATQLDLALRQIGVLGVVASRRGFGHAPTTVGGRGGDHGVVCHKFHHFRARLSFRPRESSVWGEGSSRMEAVMRPIRVGGRRVGRPFGRWGGRPHHPGEWAAALLVSARSGGRRCPVLIGVVVPALPNLRGAGRAVQARVASAVMRHAR